MEKRNGIIKISFPFFVLILLPPIPLLVFCRSLQRVKNECKFKAATAMFVNQHEKKGWEKKIRIKSVAHCRQPHAVIFVDIIVFLLLQLLLSQKCDFKVFFNSSLLCRISYAVPEQKELKLKWNIWMEKVIRSDAS